MFIYIFLLSSFLFNFYLGISSDSDINMEVRSTEWYTIQVPETWKKWADDDLDDLRKTFPAKTRSGNNIYWRDHITHTDDIYAIRVQFDIHVFEPSEKMLERYKNHFEEIGYKYIKINDLEGIVTSTAQNNVGDSVSFSKRWLLMGENYLFEIYYSSRDKNLYDEYKELAAKMVASLKEVI